MNCNCVKEVETKIAEAPFVVAKAVDNIKAVCQATGFQLTNDMGLRSVLNIPFRVTGTGKGFSSSKGKEIPCVASYCPFCGRTTGHYAIGEDAGIASAMHVAARP